MNEEDTKRDSAGEFRRLKGHFRANGEWFWSKRGGEVSRLFRVLTVLGLVVACVGFGPVLRPEPSGRSSRGVTS